MFTTLTVIAAWFSFGYCFMDILMNVSKNKNDELYRNSGHYGPKN